MRAAHRLSLGGVSWGLLVVALISGCTGDPGGVDVVTPGPGRPGRIAFVSTRNGNAEIYVMNADGSGQVNLTNRRGGDNSPAWRPR